MKPRSVSFLIILFLLESKRSSKRSHKSFNVISSPCFARAYSSQEWTSHWNKLCLNGLGTETGPCVVRDYLELYKAEMSILPPSISRQRACQSSTPTMCQECATCKICRWKGEQLNPVRLPRRHLTDESNHRQYNGIDYAHGSKRLSHEIHANKPETGIWKVLLNKFLTLPHAF